MKLKKKGLFFVLISFVFLAFGVVFATIGSQNTKVYADDTGYPHESFDDDKWVREVNTWDEMDQAFENIYGNLMYEYDRLNIVLNANLSMDCKGLSNDAYYMKRYTVPFGARITIDFNGHTLKGVDDMSETNLSYKMQDFIVFYMVSEGDLVFTDSVGGGGIEFYSNRAYDTCNIAALKIEGVGQGNLGESFESNNVTFNGGTYKLTAKTNKIGQGTLDRDVDHRGTVIIDHCKVTVNDGEFIAKSEGKVVNGTDFCARELTAFGTVVSTIVNYAKNYSEASKLCHLNTVINGGIFKSDGYAVHHFDNTMLLFKGDPNNINKYLYEPKLGDTYYVEYPTINGGIFYGGLGFTGMTFTYSEGNPELESKPADMIINPEAFFYGKTESGSKYESIAGLDWDDLHDIKACLVISPESAKMTTTPSFSTEEDVTHLERTVKDKETFSISYTKAKWLADAAINTAIYVKRKNSAISPKAYYNKDVEIDYSEYPNGLNVSCYLYLQIGDETFTQIKEFDIDVKRYYGYSFYSKECNFEANTGAILEGSEFKFKINPKEFYEVVDANDYFVYANNQVITPDENGYYIVDNVTKDISIWTEGNGVKGYGYYRYVNNGTGTTSTKFYVGDIISLKTPADCGFTFAEDIEFSGWKIQKKLYQAEEDYTFNSIGNIDIVAQTKGIYAIEVINGKAYSDEEHTTEITTAKLNDYVYIVADEAPEGFRFDYWSWETHASSYSDWLETANTEPVSKFKMWEKTGVTITAVYVKNVSEMTLIGVNRVLPGEEYILDHDISYENITISAPIDARGYKYSAPAYMYDITGYENEEVDTKSEINALGIVTLEEGYVFEAGKSYLYRMTIQLRKTYDGQDFEYAFPVNPLDAKVTLEGLKETEYEIINQEFVDSAKTYMAIYARFDCEDIITKSLVVTNGEGSGEHEILTPVEITANEPEAGKRFVRWDTTYADLNILVGTLNSEEIIIEMPNEDITLEAVYEDITVFVRGMIESLGNEEDEITVSLFKTGELDPRYSTTVAGMEINYLIEDVLPGEYILVAEKTNHTKFEQDIVVTYEEDYELLITLNPVCSSDPTLHIDENHDFYCDICHELLLDYEEISDVKVYIYEVETAIDLDITNLILAVKDNDGALELTIKDTTLYFTKEAISEMPTEDIILSFEKNISVDNVIYVIDGTLFKNELEEGSINISFKLDEEYDASNIGIYEMNGEDRIDINYSYNSETREITIETKKLKTYYVELLNTECTTHVDEDNDFYCDNCHELLLEYTLVDDIKVFNYKITDAEAKLTKLFNAIKDNNGILILNLNDKITLKFNQKAVEEIGGTTTAIKYNLEKVDNIINVLIELSNVTLTEGTINATIKLDNVNNDDVVKLYKVDGENKTELEATRENDELKFDTKTLDDYSIEITSNSNSNSDTKAKSGLPTGAIIGIVLGGVIVVAIIVFVCYWFIFRKRK